MIQERKLLWKKDKTGEEQKEEAKQSGGGDQSEKKLENKWSSMIAATASDTQQMDKFQRCLGFWTFLNEK